jgi:hypothetical protein
MLIERIPEKLSPIESQRTRYAAGLCGVPAEAAIREPARVSNSLFGEVD